MARYPATLHHFYRTLRTQSFDPWSCPKVAPSICWLPLRAIETACWELTEHAWSRRKGSDCRIMAHLLTPRKQLERDRR